MSEVVVVVACESSSLEVCFVGDSENFQRSRRSTRGSAKKVKVKKVTHGEDTCDYAYSCSDACMFYSACSDACQFLTFARVTYAAWLKVICARRTSSVIWLDNRIFKS